MSPSPTARTVLRLADKLAAGEFCVTSEFNPPDTPDPAAILESARDLWESCDAINVTDGAGANTHISSVAVCAILAHHGVDPVMQMTCRDRNRIAIQAEALGAAALGVRNILCMTGDGVAGGDQPDAKPVFDLDSAGLMETLRIMRDECRFRSGREIAAPPEFFLGSTSDPFSMAPEKEVARLLTRVELGAQFVQTQFCFDVPALGAFMKQFREAGLPERCAYLVGVGPLRSAKAARSMLKRIPGLHIPDEVIKRLDGSADPGEEGIRICVDTIHALREVDGVAGVHVMAFRRSESVREIVERAGLK